MDALVLEQVCKSFGTLRAVDSLSARVPAGSVYGFLGPNGAGKTTILRMMLDIIRPDTGRIRILDNDSLEQAKDAVGYMPEERGLYPRMKVRDVLEYLASLKGVKKGDIGGRIRDWLKTVDLVEWGEKKVNELSRGMQQRLQFVAAAINNPVLLILDEPFGGLDPVNLELLKGVVLRMRDAGTTVVLSTHMMEQAENVCDYILLINRGRKALDGSLEEIRRRYQSRTVVVEAEGDASFVRALPMVKSTTEVGKKLEIVLQENADDQELLQALVGKVRIRAFALKVPSLREIFVNVVSSDNA